ncbi:BT_3987 domain-containing protein [Pedobacter nyackensis]|uniref:BT_3987 domain-containing protein n=1 Tax=Pedobacter nyackensis TaxID=475255 RepID=UPI0029302809|nr:DUF1735 domain-containing protein [Pedobacter nyackensis]
MKKIFTIFITTCFFFCGCKKEIPFDFTDNAETVSIYMPQAINQPFSKVSVFQPILPSDPIKTVLNFGAYFGGYNPTSQDISATFVVNANGLAELNKAEALENRPPYLLLPSNMYSIESLTTTIKKGKYSSDVLNLVIDSKVIPSGSKYALPLVLSSVSNGFKISDRLNTTIFTFDVPDPWTKFAGSYKATGVFKHPTSGERAINLSATLEYQGNKTYRAPLADLAGSNYYMLLKVNDDNTVTISPSGVTPNIDQHWGPNTFDPATNTFSLNYSYNTSEPRIVVQKFVK